MFPRAKWFEERSEFGCFYESSVDVDELELAHWLALI